MTAVRIPPYPVVPEAIRRELEGDISLSFSCPNGPDPGAKRLDLVRYVLGVGSDWSSQENPLEIKVVFNAKGLASLFGPSGMVCANAAIGVAVEWTSQKASRRGLSKLVLITKQMADSSEVIGIDLGFGAGEIFGDINLSLQAFVGSCGVPTIDERNLANGVGLRLGGLGGEWRIFFDGSGSLFPLRQVINAPSDPLWRLVVEDWEDATFDEFSSDFVSLEVNRAHPSFPELYGDSTAPYATSLFKQVLATWIMLFIDVLRERTETCALEVRGSGIVTQWDAIGDVNGAYREHMLPGSIARAGWELISKGELDLSSRSALLVSVQRWVDQRFRSDQGA